MALPTVEIEVDPTNIVERKADGKGRVAIGPEYADKQVRVAVVEDLDNDEQPENEQQSG